MSSPGEKDVVRYRVDGAGLLEWVDDNWMSFAAANDASGLEPGAVIGRPLVDFFADRATRNLQQMLVDRVAATGRPVRVPFRCDGPSVRRFMELTVSPASRGGLDFASRLVREETREAVRLFSSTAARSDEFVRVCSWCKKVEVEGEWFEVERAIERLGLFEETSVPQITHGICEPCGIGLLQRLRSA